MALLFRLKNNRLRFREKFNNRYYRQVLRTGKMLLRQPVESIKQGILKVMVGVTYQCQCQCSYCCINGCIKDNMEELSTDQVTHVLEQISTLPSIFTLVSFFGGEALMREDLSVLIREACKKGLFTELESNGLLLSKDKASQLKKSGLHHVFVRLESTDRKTHDRLSNYEGCFEKALAGIRNCLETGLSCSISTIALKEKIYSKDLEKVIELGRALDVASVRIVHPTLSGRWINREEELLDEKEKKYVSSLLEPDFVYLESTFRAFPASDRGCPAFEKKFFYISPYGNIQPCPFVPRNFGHISNHPLSVLIHNMWNDDVFTETKFNGCPMNDIGARIPYVNP